MTYSDAEYKHAKDRIAALEIQKECLRLELARVIEEQNQWRECALEGVNAQYLQERLEDVKEVLTKYEAALKTCITDCDNNKIKDALKAIEQVI